MKRRRFLDAVCCSLDATVATSFRLRNDLYCVEWGVKLYSLTHSLVATSYLVWYSTFQSSW